MKSIYLAGCVVLSAIIIPLFVAETPKTMIVSLWLSVLTGAIIYYIVNKLVGVVYLNAEDNKIS